MPTQSQITRQRWLELEPLIDEALELEPERRNEFLEAACGNDLSLRHLVERLMDAGQRAGGPLDETAPVRYAQLVTAAGESLSALSGRFEIQRELGRGGMATVYLARDKDQDREVALKVLPPTITQSIVAERFVREVRFTSALAHPHILSLLDSGELNGTLFYTTPYLPGETLRERLGRESRLSTVETLRIATEVVSALEHAHRHGVVHRDIKPANILFAASGAAVVADFGIARAMIPEPGSSLTAGGLVVGTLAYMSPEQAKQAPDLDGRTDIYSLGCVVWEMLAGARPFRTVSLRDVVLRDPRRDLPSLTEQRQEVTPRLEATIRRSLASNRDERYASAAELGAELRTFLDPDAR